MTERKTRRMRDASAAYDAQTITERDLKQITRRIVRAAHPEMIILFGSRVYGTPRPNSDLDVLVVLNDATLHAAREAEIRARVKPFPVSLDVHTRTLDELTHRLKIGDDFIQEIVGRGKQVYPRHETNSVAKQVEQALELGRTHPMDNGEVVLEWVEKAEGDFVTAKVIARQKKSFRADNLCWNCEQCVEKYLKALLTRHRVTFKRDHNLEELLKLCRTVDDDFRLIHNLLDAVTICKPIIRYPGADVTEEAARAAFTATKPIRKFIRAKLSIA